MLFLQKRFLIASAVTGLLGAVFLFSGLWDIHPGEVLRTIGSFDAATLFAAALCVGFQIFFRIARLFVLSGLRGGAGWLSVAAAYSSGQVFNVLLPARAGELVKAVRLKRAYSGQAREYARIAGVLVADRVVDIVSLLGLVAGATFFGLPMGSLREAFHSAAPVWLLLVLLAILAVGLRRPIRSAFERYRASIAVFLDGMEGLQNRKRFLTALVAGITAWLFEAGALSLLCQSQGFPLPLPMILWTIFLLNLGTVVPVTLANLGTYEAVIAVALTQLGLPTNEAIGIAAAHHAVQILGVLTWAGISQAIQGSQLLVRSVRS